MALNVIQNSFAKGALILSALTACGSPQSVGYEIIQEENPAPNSIPSKIPSQAEGQNISPEIDRQRAALKTRIISALNNIMTSYKQYNQKRAEIRRKADKNDPKANAYYRQLVKRCLSGQEMEKALSLRDDLGDISRKIPKFNECQKKPETEQNFACTADAVIDAGYGEKYLSTAEALSSVAMAAVKCMDNASKK